MSLYRDAMLAISRSDQARDLMMSMPPVQRAKQRFIAGETPKEVLEVVRRLNATGRGAIIDWVGDDVFSPNEARQSAEITKGLMRAVHDQGLNASVTVKHSMFGERFGDDFCMELLDDAAGYAKGLSITMENDPETASSVPGFQDRCLRLHRRHGNQIMGVQANLRRSLVDVERLIDEGIGIRLVKGAYRESRDVAYQRKGDVNDAYRLEMRLLIEAAKEGKCRIVIGTHDHRLFYRAVAMGDGVFRNGGYAKIGMLLGVREDKQAQLTRFGCSVDVYTPVGPGWWGYVFRRFAETPRNAVFAARHLIR